MCTHLVVRNVVTLSEFMQCLIELYKCQEKGQANCQQAKGCVLIEPVVTEESETGEQQGAEGSGSYLPPVGGSVGLGSRPETGASSGDVSSSSAVSAEDTEENPNVVLPSTTNNPLHGGSGGQHRKFEATNNFYKIQKRDIL